MAKKKKNIRKIQGYLLMIFGIFIPLSALTVISYNNFMDESRYNKFIEESRNISEKDIENEQLESEKYNKNLEKDETSIKMFKKKKSDV